MKTMTRLGKGVIGAVVSFALFIGCLLFYSITGREKVSLMITSWMTFGISSHGISCRASTGKRIYQMSASLTPS